jgi:excisionase family DNA binding protein
MTAQQLVLQRNGIEQQLRKLAEECSELAVAALHLLEPGRDDAQANLLEECADVEIMLEQMRLHFGDMAVDAWRTRKLTRLEKKLGIKDTDYTAGRPVKSSEPEKPRRPPVAKSEPNPDDRLLSVGEAAKLIGLTVHAIYPAIHDGRLASEREGCHPKIHRSAALAYAKRNARA